MFKEHFKYETTPAKSLRELMKEHCEEKAISNVLEIVAHLKQFAKTLDEYERDKK